MSKKNDFKKAAVFFKEYADLLICLIIVVAIFFLSSKIFTLILISPDDIAFQNIMSGVTTGKPDAHCYFLRYPFAVILAFLYEFANNTEWYQLFLLFFLAWCFFLIFSRVHMLLHIHKIMYLITSVFTVILLFTAHIVSVEWTITAGILSMTAVFRYITMPLDMTPHSKIREYVICMLLLLSSFCIRHTVAFMFFPLMGLCWIRRTLKFNASIMPGEKRHWIKSQIIYLGVCLLAIGAIMGVHAFAYSSDSWKAYQTYTKDRSILFDYYDYPDYNTYRTEYEKAGITKEIYDLMRTDYNFVIPCNNFESIDLNAIADLSRNIFQQDFFSNIKNMLKILQETLVGPQYLILNALILLLICCNCSICKKGKWLDFAFVGAVILWAVIIAGYLAYKGRLPERVMRCIYYGLLSVFSGNLFDYIRTYTGEKSLTARILNIMCCIFLVSMVAVEFQPLYRENCENAVLARSKMQLMQYCKQNPENEYFRDFGSFSQRGELMMQHAYRADNYLGIGGWTYNSPVFQKSMEMRGCTDIYAAICNNQNIYYLVNQERADKVIKRLNEYFISEEKPIRMKIEEQFQTESETVLVLKFKSLTQ